MSTHLSTRVQVMFVIKDVFVYISNATNTLLRHPEDNEVQHFTTFTLSFHFGGIGRICYINKIQYV